MRVSVAKGDRTPKLMTLGICQVAVDDIVCKLLILQDNVV